MQATERDLISVLTRDHRQVQELFDRLQPARGPSERRRLADEVTIMLVRHAVAEEKYLFPVLRKVLPGGDTIAQEANADGISLTVHPAGRPLHQQRTHRTGQPHPIRHGQNAGLAAG